MFEFNTDSFKRIPIEDSVVIVADNFYKNPNEIVDSILQQPRKIHKQHLTPSYNTVHFFDERHELFYPELNRVIHFLEIITDSKVKNFGDGYNFYSNFQKWNDDDFNDYKNNYWYPHQDFGYTAVIYFNEETTSGTNLYRGTVEEMNKLEQTYEHAEPWRSKNDWELLYTIPSKFNRLVLFDGLKYWHGLQLDDDSFFTKYRMNQVIFFEKN